MITEILAGICLGLGAFFSITGGIGLLRFPDFYTRLHPAGVNDTMGAGLTLLGLMLLSGLSFVTVKLVFILFFMWVTGTTACHAAAKAAHLSGLEPWRVDEGGDPSSP